MTEGDPWKPAQYERFKAERTQPFRDLMALVRPLPGGSAVDLGCGTGELTRDLHADTLAADTLGVDQSDAMLDKARAFEGSGLHFERREISAFLGGAFDLVFSNAALHWVPDHVALLTKVAGWLKPGGQWAVQMPANEDHASHHLARELASESPWKERLSGWVRVSPILAPEHYAELMESLGFAEQHVRLQVYGHRLESSDGVVEWVKGTMLTDYERRLQPADFHAFLAAYRDRLRSELGHRRPYFYTYKRILFWGRRPDRA
jgi:trans-aconitate 2-methyltransferase